ncbi:MBL fold metallo-hydrolase [Nocardioides sp.]|uniref:MBL fold metallo-hydrolase n=1 Tax=Nocardioides sp. TaxID=35761 RepID=UPI0027164B8E|nr:MBL fold metallo-hydrolase [Nocardioides sp.]MDO9455768.1 MBL fold metallo-hydrolase [Nocardioides sp.]
MRLTIIGCSGSYPGPDSSASCYLLETDVGDGDDKRTWRILLDLGSGSVGVLQRYADALAVDAVLFSHLHPDHCSDLCGFYVLRKYHPLGAQPRIPVWGPSGVAERMSEAYGLPDGSGMADAFDFQEYAGPFSIGPFSIVPIPVEHPVEAYGLRVSVGSSSLGYSGDTAACEGVDRVAANVRLFLCEASFRDVDDNPPGIHLTGVEAGDTASRARAGRLVITHVPPWFDADGMVAEARTAYSGPVELAAVGATYDV